MQNFPFLPTPQGPFTFQPRLDDQPYTCTVTWNLFGQRYYLNTFQLDGTRVVTVPVTASPAGHNIQTCFWQNGHVHVVTEAAHGFRFNSVVDLMIVGCAPEDYNGRREMFVLDAVTLQFDAMVDPGPIRSVGSVLYNINMLGGYFEDSVMVFRDGQFVVLP